MNYFEDRVIDLLDAAIPELERDVIQSSIEIPPDVKARHRGVCPHEDSR